MNTTTKVIVGMAVAAAAGAALGMLLAPEKGKVLQSRLAGGAKNWLSEIGSLLDLGKNVVNKIKDESAESVSDFGTQVKEMSKN